MSSKSTYFIANWKMNGSPKDLIQIKNLDFFIKNRFKKHNKLIVYCPPQPLITYFAKKIRSKNIKFGSQDVSNNNFAFGAFTGEVSSYILKNSGAEYVIIGHSEKRLAGDNYNTIKQKINNANQNKLKIIFCIGESLKENKNKNSLLILKKQILGSLEKGLNFKNILFAYEPVWSIGTGIIPSQSYLIKVFSELKKILIRHYSVKSPKLLYGGSVNAQNIQSLKMIPNCNGYLIGGASLTSKNFIDIIQNYYS